MAEEIIAKEHPDRAGAQTEKDPFTILDEAVAEGDRSFAQIADETDREIEQEMNGEESTEETPEEGKEVQEPEEPEAQEPEEETEETAEAEESEEESEETEQAAKHPDWLVEKLQDLNPDLDTSDEEAVQSAVDEMASYKDEAEKVRKDLEAEQEANKAFYDLLSDNTDLREVTKFMYKNGVSLPTALAALEIEKGVDEAKLKRQDPDAYLELQKAKEKRKEQQEQAQKKQEQRQSTLKENAEKSETNAEAFKEEFNVDSKQFDQIAETINPEIQRLGEGLVTKNFLSIVHKGLSFDEEVAKARDEGLREGKNMKISEIKNRKNGDNLPDLGGGSSKTAEKEEEDIFSRALQPEPPISQL